LEYYKKHVNLRDSALDVKNLSSINQSQHLYEVSKTNQKIEQLIVEHEIKERTIFYQRIIEVIMLVMLLLVSVALVFIFSQHRKLNTAYGALFSKNIKIMELFQANPAEKQSEKYKKSPLTDNMQNELLSKIVAIMDNTAIICDTEFSLDKLAELVQSNHAYVSQVINTVFNKNFRSYLNEYRICEAQRLFSELNTTKYTIESVALQVGFKSPSAFRNIFKEITGVSPRFYLKSIQQQNNHD
jgi:AraC-like DNA-binding protein